MVVPCRVTVDEARDDRASGLLELQEHHILWIAALEQGDVGAQSHAADADDLVDDVDQGVPTQHPPPVGCQGGEVGVEGLGDELVLVLVDAGDQRGLLDDAASVGGLLGEPWQRTVAGAPVGLLGRLVDLLAQRLLRGRLPQPVDVEAVVGPRQQRLVVQLTDVVAVGRDAGHHRLLTLLLACAVLASEDPGAGDQAAQVPLPASRVRLVEVVEVEDELTLR